ncbi:hypothetical protein HOH87_05495 [bacterium]|jgi:cell division protein FtsB|nr:hypothetical protein [bacterium]
MKKTQNRFLFRYAVMAIWVTTFSILGLFYNIRMVEINKQLQSTVEKLQVLEELNRELELSLLSQTRLEKIEEKAISTLGMKAPRRVMYFVPDESND